LSSVFLMKNVGERGMDFTEGALWRNRDLSEALYVSVFASLHLYVKNKKHCLETSVNNCELWKNCKTVSKKN
jgi:hypothetical protein